MARMLSTPKNRRLVGLDVQAGSVAATEVSSNGHMAFSRFGTMPLPPGRHVRTMKNVRAPQFLGNLFRDMRDRHLLIPAVALVVVPRPADCQYIIMRSGDKASFQYAPNGKRYNLVLKDIHAVEIGHKPPAKVSGGNADLNPKLPLLGQG